MQEDVSQIDDSESPKDKVKNWVVMSVVMTVITIIFLPGLLIIGWFMKSDSRDDEEIK